MPILLLQKTHFKSRSKEDTQVLERYLKCWKKGDLDSLLQKYHLIQHHLPPTVSCSVHSSGQFACCFAKLMKEGKLHAATHLIGDNASLKKVYYLFIRCLSTNLSMQA